MEEKILDLVEQQFTVVEDGSGKIIANIAISTNGDANIFICKGYKIAGDGHIKVEVDGTLTFVDKE